MIEEGRPEDQQQVRPVRHLTEPRRPGLETEIAGAPEVRRPLNGQEQTVRASLRRIREPAVAALYGLREQPADEGKRFVGQERIEDEPDAAPLAGPSKPPDLLRKHDERLVPGKLRR